MSSERRNICVPLCGPLFNKNDFVKRVISEMDKEPVVLKALTNFKLPFPPSVNHYWRAIGRGRVIISEEGRRYRRRCEDSVLVNRVPKHLGRVSVAIQAFMPDKRRRDLDNLLKSTLDALTHCGVIEDDSMIDHLTISRRQQVEGGELLVTIT